MSTDEIILGSVRSLSSSWRCACGAYSLRGPKDERDASFDPLSPEMHGVLACDDPYDPDACEGSHER